MKDSYSLLAMTYIFLSGCISYVTPEFESTKSTTTSSKEAKSICYDLRRTSRCSTDGEFNATETDTTMTGAWAVPQAEGTSINQFKDVFGSRASAINMSSGGKFSTDLYMNVNLQNSWNGLSLFGAALSGFTWTIIPCWGDDRYTLYVEAESKDGLKKTYQIKGVVGTFTWLPCILGLPFTGTPSSRVEELTSAEWRELLSRMENDGFFDKNE